MATPTIKSTYSLDVETVRKLERMASRLGISKSEALRRAIRAAAAETEAEPRHSVQALEDLQSSLALTRDAGDDWAKGARHERHASSRRREAGGP